MNTITHKLNGVTRISMSDHVIKGLRSYSTQGRSFDRVKKISFRYYQNSRLCRK